MLLNFNELIGFILFWFTSLRKKNKKIKIKKFRAKILRFDNFSINLAGQSSQKYLLTNIDGGNDETALSHTSIFTFFISMVLG